MEEQKMKKTEMVEQKVQKVVLPEGKCGTLYCGDCSYFNASKTSYGKCWCGYFKSYSRDADDSACRYFTR